MNARHLPEEEKIKLEELRRDIDYLDLYKKAGTRAISAWGCEQTGWTSVSLEEAEKIAEGKTLDELDNMTGVRSSVNVTVDSMLIQTRI